MSKKRKDEHLRYAKAAPASVNDFSRIRFVHHSVPSLSINDIDLSTTIFNQTFPYPFYINAMTGGSKKGDAINIKLAALANHFKIPFFLGSQSLAFKDEGGSESYEELRKLYPDLFIVSNINPNFTREKALKAINMVQANALAIHVNSVQEMVMTEGDRDFTSWSRNIQDITKDFPVPIIVKEVGYGMHQVTLDTLSNLGVTYLDISGMGGTNFTDIELKRRGEEHSPLQNFGLSTLTALKIAKDDGRFHVYASGGIKDAADIIKALALGAEATGMARYFLGLSDLMLPQMIKEVENLILDLKKILVLLNVSKVNKLGFEHLYYL